MAINESDLTTKLGVLFGGLVELNAFRGATTTTREATIRTAYGVDADGILNGLTDAVSSMQAANGGWAGNYSTLVSNTIVAAVEDDRKLSSIGIDEALTEWLRQLLNTADTFNDCPSTLSLTAPATGGPAIVADYTFHTIDLDVDGRHTDFGIPDKYLITVAADADNGGSRWSETLAIVSRADTAGLLDAAYPTGTGINTTFSVTDPASDSGLLTDGGFDNFSTPNFTSWTTLTGNAVTAVFQGADDLRDGAAGFCLQLKSDGTHVTGVKQTFTIRPSTVYSLHFAVNLVNAAMTTAKLHVSLRRVDTGAIVTDDQSVAISKDSLAMSGLTIGTWTHSTFAFATPARLPATGVYLDIRLADGTTVTTPATVNTEIKVDHVVLQAVSPLYTRGVGIVVYSGKVEPSRRDQWEYGVALTSGVVSSYFIRWLDRTVGIASRTDKFPTVAGGGETILDSLIV